MHSGAAHSKLRCNATTLRIFQFAARNVDEARVRRPFLTCGLKSQVSRARLDTSRHFPPAALQYHGATDAEAVTSAQNNQQTES
jgi:hypothetical protein